MKISKVLNQAETVHAGMEIGDAIKLYSVYHGITLKYCEEAVFIGDDGKYYSIQPRAVLLELNEEEIKNKLSHLPKCPDPSCDGHLIIDMKDGIEIQICNICGKF